ncbi:MAG TPA: hypothetical protein VFL61_11470 [Gaiellaceae bacterium]|nr:hypothetical protein [Gaiellaceae bacterium]
MSETVATDAPRPARRWGLRILYGILVLAALALVLLVTGEIVYSFEDAHERGEHEHGFYGPIFDAAWVAFLPAALVTFVAGMIALPVGWLRGSAELRRYGAQALSFCAVAVVVVALAEMLG